MKKKWEYALCPLHLVDIVSILCSMENVWGSKVWKRFFLKQNEIIHIFKLQIPFADDSTMAIHKICNKNLKIKPDIFLNLKNQCHQSFI